jgi:hypothetical protein
MALLTGFNISLDEVGLLEQASQAAFAGGNIPAGWNVVTPAQLGLASQYSDGIYFTDPTSRASAIVLQQGSSYIVAFRGTDDSTDTQYFPELGTGAYIHHYDPLLNGLIAKAPSGASFAFTGASLGGGATNLMAEIAGSAFGGRFAAATFVGIASPIIKTAAGILNIGFENDPIYKGVNNYADFPSSLDNLVLATDKYMAGNYDGRHPTDAYAHSSFLGFEALGRLAKSVFYDVMTPDSVVIFDANAGLVHDVTPGRENTGAFYLGENVADSITGGGGNDFLEGFGGNDTLNGGLGDDNIDGGEGVDTAIFSSNYSAYALTDLGNGSVRVAGPDGTDTLRNIESLKFSDQTVQWPSAGRSSVSTSNHSDYNGDGTSDLFWRNGTTGHVGIWEMHKNVPTWHDLGSSGVDHKAAGIGDFNGDGTSDILWRNDSTGHVGAWEMHNDVQTWRDLGGSGVDHKVVGIGDFNGDGTSDVLWRNDASGHTGFWEMHNNVPTWRDLGGSGTDHKVVGVGDFNGDGTSDILWRNDSTGHVGIWEMHNNVPTWRDLGGSGTDHKVIGVDDFNGDGTSDILWRNDSTGHVGTWEMHNDVQTWRDLGGSGIDSKVAGIGDYNGDGTSDLFWRNDATGHVEIWEMHNNIPTWHDIGGSGVDHFII